MANRGRRINKEMEDLRKDEKSGMRAVIINDDISTLRGFFRGPPDTPYEGGEFVVEIKIPNEYPFKPPQMRFETKVWHPNVSSQTGAICLDTLSAAWSPVLTIKSALLSLQSLLATPEPKDPQDAEVAGMMIREPEQFRRRAREWAVRFAGAPAGTLIAGEPSTPASREAEARRKAEEERQKILQYEGYPRHIVDQFTSMGFDIPRVVAALKATKVGKGDMSIDGQKTEQVVEVLLGNM